jgi:hypothetical protein
MALNIIFAQLSFNDGKFNTNCKFFFESDIYSLDEIPFH